MGKAAVTKKTTSAAGRENQQSFDVIGARSLFFTSAINMSWQLALTIVIPVVAGVKLDQWFDSSPSLTLTGFFLAIAMGSMVVWNTVKGVNEVQAEEDKRDSRTARRKKRAT